MTREQLLEYFELAGQEIREAIRQEPDPEAAGFFAVIPPINGIPEGTAVTMVLAVGNRARQLRDQLLGEFHRQPADMKINPKKELTTDATQTEPNKRP